MTNLEFYTTYLTEKQCLSHFKSLREEQGIVCKCCSSKDHNWNNEKKQFRCRSCGFRTGIKSNTLLENSNLPIRKWYEAFHLVTMSKKPTSAKTLERHLNVHYETAWFLLQKIRIALGKRNRDYTMSGNIEVDECMLAVMDLSEETNSGEKPRKRGRGSNEA
ncbi:MAG: IS1595 family transposase, partial [Bacteroidia bacterium]